jgi:hypothetical protein
MSQIDNTFGLIHIIEMINCMEEIGNAFRDLVPIMLEIMLCM